MISAKPIVHLFIHDLTVFSGYLSYSQCMDSAKHANDSKCTSFAKSSDDNFDHNVLCGYNSSWLYLRDRGHNLLIEEFNTILENHSCPLRKQYLDEHTEEQLQNIKSGLFSILSYRIYIISFIYFAWKHQFSWYIQ